MRSIEALEQAPASNRIDSKLVEEHSEIRPASGLIRICDWAVQALVDFRSRRVFRLANRSPTRRNSCLAQFLVQKGIIEMDECAAGIEQHRGNCGLAHHLSSFRQPQHPLTNNAT